MRELIVGIDGGGTKTKFVAFCKSTKVQVAESVSGSIHTGIFSEECIVNNINSGIAALGISDDDCIVAVGIGDPAIDDETEKGVLEKLINSGKTLLKDAKCYIKSDVFMALYGYTDGDSGALMVAGTGSMGVALKKPHRIGAKNEITTVGGWGNPTTDYGSGYYIAVKGIQSAIDYFDGIGPETEVAKKALNYFNVTTPRSLIDIFNGSDITKSEIAAFAKEVAVAADEGDKIALDILTTAGSLLGEYANVMLKETEKKQVGIFGSVLKNNKIVQKVFTDTVVSKYRDARVSIPKREPQVGAAVYAARAMGIKWESRL